MTVINPNSVAGINSITVQSGNSLAVHKANGELIRTLTSSSGVSTFSSISVGTATTDNSAAKSINIGLGASISQHNDNTLSFGTSGDERVSINSVGVTQITKGTSGGATANTDAPLILDNSSHSYVQFRTPDTKEQGLLFGDDADNNVGSITYSHSTNALSFAANASERLRIDSSGRVLIGHNSSLAIGGGDNAPLQTSATSSVVFGGVRYTNASGGPFLSLSKSRAAAAGSNTIVQNGDELGTILFSGDDGTDLISKGAQIQAQVDGAPGSNDMPGRLLFYTTADDAASPTERLRIDSSGRLGIQGAATRALLEVRASGGSNTMLTALWGANEGTTAGTLTDNTDKAVRMGVHHYDTDALPYGLLVASSTSGANNLTFGGGTSLMNAATEIKFQTAANTTTATGTERLRIDSSGVITLGNISNTVLQASICNSVSGHQFISQCDDNNNGFEIYQKHGSTSTRNTLSVHANTGTSSAKKTQFVVRGDGNVGINPDGSGPDRLLHVSDSNQAGVVTPFRLTNITGQAGTEVRMEFECGVDEIAWIGAKNEGSDIGPLTFATATSQAAYPTEKARINPGGSFTVGTTNDDGGGSSNTDDGCVLRKDGLIAARVTTTTNNVAFTAKTTDTGGCNGLRCMSAQTEVGGVSFNSGGTNFNQSSDYRRKENIVDLTDSITRLKTLLPKRFNFKTEPSVTRDGFLAHEVTAVPEAVTGTKDAVATENDVLTNRAANVGDPIYQQLDQSKLVPLLTAALQEAVTKIETLETKVAALEGG